LWAVFFAVKARWWQSALLLGLAILTKENAGAIVAGLIVWLALRRAWSPIPIMFAGLLPAAGYWIFVSQRFGYIPPLDPYLRVTTSTIGTPVVSLVRSFTDAYSSESMIAVALHLGAGIVVVALLRTSLFALIGGVAALQLLSAGPFGWRFIGDASRISTIFEIFVVLAIAAWKRPTWPEPATVPLVPDRA
jgi:uncharacterized membrane protein